MDGGDGWMSDGWMDGGMEGGMDGPGITKLIMGCGRAPSEGELIALGDRGGSGWCQKRLGLLAMKSQVVVMLSTNESRPETHMGQGRGCVGFEQVGPASMEGGGENE